MKKFRFKLIHLSRTQHMSRLRMKRLLLQDPKLTHLYELTVTELKQSIGVTSQEAKKIYQDLRNDKLVYKIYEESKKYHILTYIDPLYPSGLKEISDPPLVLYTSKNLIPLPYENLISVIGTRNPTSKAFQKTKQVIPGLVSHQKIIVSGLAKGIDAYAHKQTLDSKGFTIAVLGSGFERFYPSENTSLFLDIIEKGLVISEYPPDMAARSYHFPERNRIISGLSAGTVVIESSVKSGTLITVDQALDQGRDVYVMPGCPLEKETLGNHQLIQQGASLIVNYQDILK